MRNRVKEYVDFAYSTFVVPDVTTDDEPCYMAYHPELEGCMSHGNTPEEALHNLREVAELYISTLRDKGLEVPHPQAMGVTWHVMDPASNVETDTYVSPSITPPIFSFVT